MASYVVVSHVELVFKRDRPIAQDAYDRIIFAWAESGIGVLAFHMEPTKRAVNEMYYFRVTATFDRRVEDYEVREVIAKNMAILSASELAYVDKHTLMWTGRAGAGTLPGKPAVVPPRMLPRRRRALVGD